MPTESSDTMSVTGPRKGSEPAVEVVDVARRFGGRWALRGVTLRVEPGEVVALLGHNGSGKTTLLRIIATLLRPTRGGGTVLGHDLIRDAAEVRACVGVLGHSPGLYGDLTARENLVFALRMAGRPVDRGVVEAALHDVGLARDADELVRGFSAGMQRRLALARLLLREPRVLLLDEPFASFDSDGIAMINALLARHKAAGNAAIITTHNLQRAEGVVDRTISLSQGKVVSASPARIGGPLPVAASHGGVT